MKKQPWCPADATRAINGIAREAQFTLALTAHAKERLQERDLFTPDLLYVLKHGFVYEEPEPSTLNGFFKYQIEGPSPSSRGRTLRVVAVPDEVSCQIKIITVMWRDED